MANREQLFIFIFLFTNTKYNPYYGEDGVELKENKHLL